MHFGDCVQAFDTQGVVVIDARQWTDATSMARHISTAFGLSPSDPPRTQDTTAAAIDALPFWILLEDHLSTCTSDVFVWIRNAEAASESGPSSLVRRWCWVLVTAAAVAVVVVVWVLKRAHMAGQSVACAFA